MKRVFNSVAVILISLMVYSCDDVFEEDISNDLINIVHPTNNDIINGNSVDFRWNTLSGADDYRVQVTDMISNQVIIDSLVSQDRLIVPLLSGKYSWRIRGENFAYQTAYNFPSMFVVKATNDLTAQTIFLNSPSDNLYTRNNTIILTWAPVNAATSYDVEIDKIVNGNAETVLQQNEVTETTFTLDESILSEDAQYNWKIKALNDNSQTRFFGHTIFLDTQVPNQPTLTSPNDNDTESSLIVDFSWSIGQDTGNVQSALSSVIEISTDENFSSLVQTYTTIEESQQHTFATAGDYYWRVQIIDAAGNDSIVSESRVLTVEE